MPTKSFRWSCIRNQEPQGGWHCTSTFYQTHPNHQTQASWPSMPLDPKITGPAPQYEPRMQANAHRHAQTDEEATKKWWHRIRNIGVKEPMIHAGILTILHTYLGQATNQCLFSMIDVFHVLRHQIHPRYSVNSLFSTPALITKRRAVFSMESSSLGSTVFQQGWLEPCKTLTLTDPENTQQTLNSTLSSEAKLPVHDLLCIEIPSRLAARVWAVNHDLVPQGKTSSQHVSEKISESAIKLVCTNSNRHPRQGTGVQNQQAVNVLSPLKVGNIDHQHIWCQSLRQLTQRLKNNKLNDSEKIKIVLWSSCWAPQADIQSFDNQSFMRWGKTDWHNWTGTKSDTRSQKKNTLLRV